MKRRGGFHYAIKIRQETGSNERKKGNRCWKALGQGSQFLRSSCRSKCGYTREGNVKHAVLIGAIIMGAFLAESDTSGATAIATFSGGCFWCMQPPFDSLPGVAGVTVGYTGGTVKNPTYEQVCTGTTGHMEAVQVVYDPAKISYDKLLDVYWRSIDPTDAGGQFADRGRQYRTAIFYHTPEQKMLKDRRPVLPAPVGKLDGDLLSYS